MPRPPVLRRRTPAPPRSAGPRAAGVLAASLLTGCYTGDFFDRLVDPDTTAAFRIIQLTLVDPHTYSGDMVLCNDSTVDFNDRYAMHVEAFDINTTLVLHPLDPLVAQGANMEIVPAQCVPGGALVNCTDKDVLPSSIVEAEFNNLQGTCGAPVAGTLNPDYTASVRLNAPVSPCFLSALIPKLDLQVGPDLRLPLSNVQIAAAYQLDPNPDEDGEPQRLVDGLLFGFLPASLATSPVGSIGGTPFVPWDSLAGGNACQVDPQNPIDDIDTVAVPRDGVWMYFNFTAERVAWSSEADAASDTSAGS